MCDVVCESLPVPVVKVGTNDCFGRSGPAKELLSLFGLDAAAIAEKARIAVGLKQ